MIISLALASDASGSSYIDRYFKSLIKPGHYHSTELRIGHIPVLHLKFWGQQDGLPLVVFLAAWHVFLPDEIAKVATILPDFRVFLQP